MSHSCLPVPSFKTPFQGLCALKGVGSLNGIQPRCNRLAHTLRLRCPFTAPTHFLLSNREPLSQRTPRLFCKNLQTMPIFSHDASAWISICKCSTKCSAQENKASYWSPSTQNSLEQCDWAYTRSTRGGLVFKSHSGPLGHINFQLMKNRVKPFPCRSVFTVKFPQLGKTCLSHLCYPQGASESLSGLGICFQCLWQTLRLHPFHYP